jgi:hypothetical protein
MKVVYLDKQSFGTYLRKVRSGTSGYQLGIKIPYDAVQALERIVRLSNHAPILYTTGLPRPPSIPQFKFEKG